MPQVDLIVLPHPLLDDGTYSTWQEKYPDRSVYTSLESALENFEEPGLFSSNSGIEIIDDDIKAQDLRSFLRINSFYDIMIISTKKPRANFSKDGVQVTDLSHPTNTDFKRIAHRLGVEPPVVSKILKRKYPHPQTTVSALWQASFLDDHGDFSGLDIFELSQQDLPPWDITDAIVQGRPYEAFQAVNYHCSRFRKKSDSISLMFQLLGYFSKIVYAQQGKGSGFFIKNSKRLHDAPGLVEDLSVFPDMIIQSKNPDLSLAALCSSMARRFIPD